MFTCIHSYNWSELNIFKNMCKEQHPSVDGKVEHGLESEEEQLHGTGSSEISLAGYSGMARPSS